MLKNGKIGMVSLGGIEAAFYGTGLSYAYWDERKQKDVRPIPPGPPLAGRGGVRFGGIIDCRGDPARGRMGDRRGEYSSRRDPHRFPGCQVGEGVWGKEGEGADAESENSPAQPASGPTKN